MAPDVLQAACRKLLEQVDIMRPDSDSGLSVLRCSPVDRDRVDSRLPWLVE
jgi:hypothetical protein